MGYDIDTLKPPGGAYINPLLVSLYEPLGALGPGNNKADTPPNNPLTPTVDTLLTLKRVSISLLPVTQ